MKRLVALLALSGCQLIIGEIELPTLVGGDAGADATALDAAVADAAGADGTPPDATVLADGGPPDAAWDGQTPPDAAPLDAAPVDQGVTPWAPTSVAGTWHVYGMRGRRRQISFLVAALQVAEDGTALIVDLSTGAPLSDAATPLSAHPEAPAHVSTNFFPVAGLLTGTLDGRSGVGVLVNDAGLGNTEPAFFALVRAGADVGWPDTSIYAHLRVLPVGTGELGVLQVGGDYTAIHRIRLGDAPVGQPDRPLDFGRDPTGRAVFTPRDEQERFLLTPAQGEVGGAGEYEAQGARVGLALAFRGGGTLAPAQRFFCGGGYFDDTGAFATPGIEALTHATREGMVITLADGRDLLTAERVDGLVQVAASSNLFHRADGLGAVEPTGRVVFLLDGDPTAGTGQWAAGLCVALGD